MNQHDLCKLFRNPLHLNSHLKNISCHGVKTSLTTTRIIFFLIFFTSSYSFISLIDNKNNSPWFIACSSLKERPSLSAVQFSMLWEALRFKELTCVGCLWPDWAFPPSSDDAERCHIIDVDSDWTLDIEGCHNRLTRSSVLFTDFRLQHW